jgi:hypothetical protein
VPKGHNADAAVYKDTDGYIGHMNTNEAHLWNQVSVRD